MSSQDSALPPRSPLAVLLLVAIIAAAAGFAYFVIAQQAWIDDSFISFRYARNFVAGHGLTFNVGDPVEGYTNFLWTLVTSVGLALGFEAMPFSQVMGLVAMAVTLWCVYEIARGSGLTGWRPVLAPFCLATSFAFLAYPMTGMETSFFTMLLTVSFLAIQRGLHQRLVGGLLLGALLFALGTARFDGFGPVILLLSYPLLFGGRERRFKAYLTPIAVFVGAMLVYNLWRLSYYPTPLPNTFHAKTTFSFERCVEGFRYLWQFVKGDGMPLCFLAVIPIVGAWDSKVARHAGWVVLGQFGYATVVGGDWMMHFRFLLPVLPLLCVLAAEGLLVLYDGTSLWSKDGSAPKVPGAPLSIMPIAAVLAFLGFTAGQLRSFDEHLEFEEIAGPFFTPHDAAMIGRYMAENYPAEPLVAIEWGGIVPLYIENDILDTWGLTDTEFAQNEKLQKTKWGTLIGPRLIAAREPELIICNARLMPTREAAMKSVEPGGPNHYRFYPQMVSEASGYDWQFVEIEPGQWWSALVRVR